MEEPYGDEFEMNFTLRDWFAGKALANRMITGRGGVTGSDYPEEIANEAYRVADAMLKERAK